MAMDIGTFSGDVALNAAIHYAYPNRAAELQAIATALGTDTTTHDQTIEKPPAALQPGAAGNSRFTNDVLLVVNAGKAGNLTPAAMAAAITNGLASEFPPVNTTAPVASGTGTVGQVLSVTNGVWTYSPTSYSRQWMRASTPIAGATGASYTLVAADSGNPVACFVTATNPAGAATAASNAIAVA